MKDKSYNETWYHLWNVNGEKYLDGALVDEYNITGTILEIVQRIDNSVWILIKKEIK